MDSSILSFNAEKYVFSWLLAYLSWSFWSLLYLRFRGTQERIWAIVQKFPTKCFRSDSGPAPQSLSPTFVFLKGIKVYLAISGRFCTVQTLQDQKFSRSKFCLIFKAVYTVQDIAWYCLHKSYFLKRSLVSYLSQFQCRKVRFFLVLPIFIGPFVAFHIWDSSTQERIWAIVRMLEARYIRFIFLIVKIFWEGHKNLAHLPLFYRHYLVA